MNFQGVLNKKKQSHWLRDSGVIIAAVLILAIGWGIYWYSHRITSDYFIGRVQKIDGQVVTLTGSFQNDKHPEISGPEHEVTIQVAITPDTRFTKIVLQMPTWAQLAKTGGFYEPGKLASTTEPGSLRDIADLHIDGLYVHASGNVYGDTQFPATDVTYYYSGLPQ